MNPATNIVNHQAPTLVVGLGLTGWSVVRYLDAQGKSIAVTDTREIPPYLDDLKSEYPHIEFIPNLDHAIFSQYNEVVVSPGLAPEGANTIGDIELFVRAAKAPIIAITGSNGKSTVTTLVGKMLNAGGYNAQVGGNIGTPALDLLLQETPDFYVLELSSFQLDTTQSLSAKSAVILNISEDHLDRYNSLDGYIASKNRIFNNAEQCIINLEDMPLDVNDRVIGYSLDMPTTGNFGIVIERGQRHFAHATHAGLEVLAPVSQLKLQGEQNVSNMLAAMALIFGADIRLTQPMVEAGLRFRGLPHRCEFVGEWDKVTWINDSKGTNVGATLAAIDGSENPIVLIAGGQGKGADFSPLKNAINERAHDIIIFGEDAKKIADAINIDNGSHIHFVDDLEQAVASAKRLANAGDNVLFSPACASFDMFDSYVHRGDQFKRLVKEAYDVK